MTAASIGRYRVVSRLGASWIGKVFRAEDTTLGRRVVLKVEPMFDDVRENPRFAGRMKRLGLPA